MPDLLGLSVRWWKQIMIVVILSLIAVGIITFMKPKQYLATATAVPASSFGADRSRIFNENIQALYSTLGTTDDLDMIVGTGHLDTVYFAVTDEFNLYDHYKVKEQGEAARHKAAFLLQKNALVYKSDYGELKVKVWDTDAKLSAELANSILKNLDAIHRDLQSELNKASLVSLRSERELLNKNISDSNRNVSAQQILKYDKLIIEYQLLVNSRPPVLLTVESARTPSWPDRPKRIRTLVATGFLSLVFSLLAALALERRKKTGL